MSANDWVGMTTAVVGTLVSVIGLVLQLRSRDSSARRSEERVADVDRWEETHVSRARTSGDAEAAHAEAARRRAHELAKYRKSQRLRRWAWVYKALAAVILSGLSMLSALAFSLAADFDAEPVPTGSVLWVLGLAGVGVLLGLSARRDVKSDSQPPWRLWIAWVAIVIAVLLGLMTVGLLADGGQYADSQ